MPREMKNPMKYIQRLKQQLKWAGESVDHFRDLAAKRLGSYWFTYEDGVTKSVSNLSIEQARKVRIGSEVIMRGNVLKIEQIEPEKVTVTFSVKDVRCNE